MKKLVFALVSCLLIIPCSAEIIIVDNDWPYDFNNIQAAIDYSSDGDFIIVFPGTYTGQGNRDIDFLGKAITVRSINQNDPIIVASTIIDCQGTSSEPHRGFYFHNSEDANSVIAGFTIKSGYADDGGGIYCTDSGPKITNCTFSGNGAHYYGGGMYSYYAGPTVTDCVFSGNSADKGGGMHNYESSPTITNCTFSGNSASDKGGGMFNDNNSSPALNNCVFIKNVSTSDGGGMYNHDSSLKVTNCTFTENSANSYGGVMFNYYGSLTIANCTFVGNSAYYGGGGMFNYENSPTITNCTFNGNSAYYGGGGMYNGGANSSLTVTNCVFIGNSASGGSGMSNSCGYSKVNNCTFTDNFSDYWGGGMENRNGMVNNCTFNGNSAGIGGGGLIVKNTVVQNCLFTRNSAGEDGGGLYTDRDTNSIVKNCTFSQNSSSQWGGGMIANESTPTVTNCIFIDNSADSGGAILNFKVNYDGRPGSKVSNCTLVGNSAGSDGGAIANLYYSSPAVTNCIIWDNIAIEHPATNDISNEIESGITLTYSDIQDGWPGLGNIAIDPCFVDADANDYHLKSEGWRWDSVRNRWTYDDVTSRCIDAGNPGSPLGDELLSVHDDPDNVWGQNLRIDMGAFGGTAEASIPPYDWALLGDLTNDGIVDLKDYAYQAADWLSSADSQPGDLNRDGLIDIDDLALLVDDWLAQTSWH